MRPTLRTICYDLGRILKALAAMMLVSMVVPVVWTEYFAIPGLALSAALTYTIGAVLTRTCAGATEPAKLHGMIIAAGGWLVVAILGSLPFLFVAATIAFFPAFLNTPPLSPTVAAFLNPLNGIFESMSGFTGSGLTMAVHEPKLPATLLWWRSFIQWVGGVGVIVLTTAVLARPGSGSLTLYESEARSEKIHPSILSTVRSIWWIFLLFTFVSILLLWLAGMSLWGAINHAMTGLATGGFSITDQSIATYDSALIDFALIPVMTLGSIAFPIHYLVLRGDIENFYTDLQTRWVFGFFGLGSAVLCVLLYVEGPYETVFAAVRYGLFQFVSAASCTGFQTAMTLGRTWSPEALLVMSGAMVVGAAAGSTVGGIKLIRVLVLSKGTIHRISSVFYPDSAIRPFRLNGRRLSDDQLSVEFEEATIITLLWLFFLALGIAVFLVVEPAPAGERYALVDVIFEIASAQGNVGITTGITGPDMALLGKLMLIFNMWIGRLEIIPVVVLLRSLLFGTGYAR